MRFRISDQLEFDLVRRWLRYDFCLKMAEASNLDLSHSIARLLLAGYKMAAHPRWPRTFLCVGRVKGLILISKTKCS